MSNGERRRTQDFPSVLRGVKTMREERKKERNERKKEEEIEAMRKKSLYVP